MPGREAELDRSQYGGSHPAHRTERDCVTKGYSHLQLAYEEQGTKLSPTHEQTGALGNGLGAMWWLGRSPFVHEFPRSTMQELASDTVLEQTTPQPPPRPRERSRDVLAVDVGGSAEQRRPLFGRKMILFPLADCNQRFGDVGDVPLAR